MVNPRQSFFVSNMDTVFKVFGFFLERGRFDFLLKVALGLDEGLHGVRSTSRFLGRSSRLLKKRSLDIFYACTSGLVTRKEFLKNTHGLNDCTS